MLANNRLSGICSHRRSSQAGTAAVEFALVAILFFALVFSVLELARAMYVFNTLQEVTRRAASELVNMAPADANSTAMIEVRRRAIFRDSGDGLPFADPIAMKHIRIDYLSLVRDVDGSMKKIPTQPLPSCPEAHRTICMANPNDARCVRFVRVRICEPGGSGACDPVPYKVLFPFVNLSLKLPRAATIATAESLGFTPGMTCP